MDKLNWTRILLAIVFPPLAVADKGADKLIITTVVWLMMFPLGSVAAFYFLLNEDKTPKQQPVNRHYQEKPKRDNRQFIELADGELLEVVDTEDEERRKRLQQ